MSEEAVVADTGTWGRGCGVAKSLLRVEWHSRCT
jgi:hypothetical protein